MSVLGNPLLLGSADQYRISRSLRFNSSDSGYCAFTPGSVGNRKTFTFSAWVKRTTLSSAGYKHIFSTGNTLTESGYFGISFWEDKLDVTTGAADLRKTSAVYRDISAWYHIVVAVDTTQGTAANRVKVYVNGLEVTAFQTSNNPSPSADLAVSNTIAHNIGRNTYNSSDYFDGYLSEVWFVGGLALTPNDFGETNQTTGQWIPKRYTGSTAGTNTYQLTFSDNSNTTAATLGKDTSPNGNNWTPTNFSVTAGAGNDSLVDTPTSYGTDTGAGGEVRGNYCTWNPLTANSVYTLTNGNLDISCASTSAPVALATIAVNSGKWYWEVTLNDAYAYPGAAIVSSRSSVDFLGQATGQFIYNTGSPSVSWVNGSSYNYSTASVCAAGDVIGVALNFDGNTITFYKNGVSQGVFSNSVLGSSTWAPAFKVNGISSASFNFGQRPWAFPSSVPSGFRPLVDTFLSTPVAKSSSAFDVKLYTGNGSTQTISGLGFSPDLLWFKRRNGINSNTLFDIIRGSTKSLLSDSTAAEATEGGGLSTFNSDGFSLSGDTTVQGSVNGNTKTYVAWCWDAGSTTTTINANAYSAGVPSITSSVRANASAGFSIVTYTGAGSTSSTIGHGLGVAPSFIITKARTTASQVNSWRCYHRSLGATQYLTLNATDTAGTFTDWANTAPTSSVFYVGGTNTTFPANESGINYVAYCFAPVSGYSAMGSYVGNGSTDGVFVYTGFRPKFLMIKRTNNTSSWMIRDTARDPYNVASADLYANSSIAESSYAVWDLLSNGFKARGSAGDVNGAGDTYIYFAVAESPFQYARAR